MPQKSVSVVCSSTTLARLSAPSPTMPLKPTLQDREDTEWVSAGRNGLGPLCVAAYLSSCREELTSNAFAREAAPCGPILFCLRLGAEKGTSRQRVVTEGCNLGKGNSLKRHQRAILLKGLRELDDAGHVAAVVGEVVVVHTAIGGDQAVRGS